MMTKLPNDLGSLTQQQMNEIRRRYTDGETTRQLANAYGVSLGWLYARVRDIKKYHKRPKYPLPRPRKIVAPLVDPKWTIKQMLVKCPHYILYMFASGHLDDAQLSEISVRNRNLEFELSAVSQDRCLAEIVRDYPTLLLRTMVRYEVFQPQCRPGRSVRRSVREAEPQPFEDVVNTDPDRFDPRTTLMQDIARLAIGFAAD